MDASLAVAAVTDFSSSESPTREDAAEVVRLVKTHIEALRQRAGDYPDTPMTADVFMDSLTLSDAARALSFVLRKTEYTDIEEQATRLWCSAVLATRSHYHYVVGPAMIARAECNERLGKAELAFKIYQAVILDFSWFVSHWEEDDSAIALDDFHALEQLVESIEGAIRCDGETEHASDWHALSLRAVALISRGTT